MMEASPSQDLSAIRPCGSCSLCCKVFDVEAVDKVAHEWCRHYVSGVGCGIHSARPKICRGYQCLWTVDHSLGDEWKPDRCGFIMHWGKDGLALWINVDLQHCGAWRKEPYYSQIKRWSEMVGHRTGIVTVCEGDRCFVIFPEQDLPVSQTSPEQISAGYRRRPGWRQPFAKVKEKDGSVREFVGVPIPELR